MAAPRRPNSEVHRHALIIGRSCHHTPTVVLVTSALAFLFGGLPVETEIVFHRRDHVDQGKYLSNQPVYNIRSYSDALVSHTLSI